MLCAESAGVPAHLRSAIANVKLSLDTLTQEMHQSLLSLVIVETDLIFPIHGAVVWDLRKAKELDWLTDEVHERTGQDWLTDEAHKRLEWFQSKSLLQGIGRDERHNQALAYTIQPVIAQVLRRFATNMDFAEARERYARWEALVAIGANDAYNVADVHYDGSVSQAWKTSLPDLSTALPLLPVETRGRIAWKAATIYGQFGKPIETAMMLEMAETTARDTNDRKLLNLVRAIDSGRKMNLAILTSPKGLL